MNQQFRFRRLPQAIALAVVAITLHTSADAADLRKRLNVRQEASEVVLGETMYDYYMGDSFRAMNDILLAKAEGRLDEGLTDSEVLLSDLYTAFGMPDEADTVLSRVASNDMRSQTRNETLFRKGRLQYHLGNFFEAERVLNVPLSTQITDLEAERRVMLANVLMARNEFDAARDLLAPIPLNTSLGIYATYNMGVAHLRANRAQEGIRLLETVMNQPVSDSETNALKDRAALAIGYNYLQAQDPDKARDALLNVRLEGPFSNSALLALGYANFERKEYKRSLSFWLELLTRNPSDPSVQEAMLFAPRAYEALNANQQAFFGYKLAVTTLNNQLAVLDKIATDVKSPDWADKLSPSADGGIGADPMAVPPSLVPGDREQTAILYDLFAQQSFNAAFQQYQQLRRLQALMEQRAADLRAMHDNAAILRKRQAQMPSLQARVDALQSRLERVSERWPVLEKRARQTARDSRNISGTVSVENMQRQYKLQRMDELLAKQANTPANAALRNRVRILRGLVLMDIASHAPASQEQIYADVSSNDTELERAKVRLAALQQLLADNRKTAGADNDARLQVMEARLQATTKALKQALDEHRTYLRQLAENQLDDIRNRVNNDLAEAHLNIARLQDAAMIRDDRQAGTIEKPQP